MVPFQGYSKANERYFQEHYSIWRAPISPINQVLNGKKNVGDCNSSPKFHRIRPHEAIKERK